MTVDTIHKNGIKGTTAVIISRTDKEEETIRIISITIKAMVIKATNRTNVQINKRISNNKTETIDSNRINSGPIISVKETVAREIVAREIVAKEVVGREIVASTAIRHQIVAVADIGVRIVYVPLLCIGSKIHFVHELINENKNKKKNQQHEKKQIG